jgi:L-aminopeptidase/D-esterase-like protein
MTRPVPGPSPRSGLHPGPRNALTDVAGLRVGQAEDHTLLTGTTVVLPDLRAIAAVDVRGGGPGSRETDLLSADGTVEAVDAIVLSGGSAFGLDAAGGVTELLRRQGRGYPVGALRVPIVPAAILFDLHTAPGPDGAPLPQDWTVPPWRALGHRAAATAGLDVGLGNAGAGLGAKAGPLKGGQGTASFVHPEFTVAALVAANPLGSVLMPGTATFWTWWLEQDGELGHQPPPTAAPAAELLDHPDATPGNTTLAVVATDVALTRVQARRVAVMAQDGIARAIRPVHSPLDGDTVFVLSTGARPLNDPLAGLTRLGMLAADCVSRAIMRGVYHARGIPGLPAWRDLYGPQAQGR